MDVGSAGDEQHAESTDVSPVRRSEASALPCSAIDHTLETVVQDLAARAKTAKSSIAVHCSGPNIFTVSVSV